MGKIIFTYPGYTTSDIINRATSGISTMTALDGSTINCSDITMTGLKNAIGHNSTNLAGICSSNNVNIYSGFSPVEWYLAAGALNHRIKTPYTMGSFAGYNHNATAPEVISYTESLAINSNVQTNIGIAVSFDISEVNWYEIGIRKVGVNTKLDGVSQAISYATLNGSSYDIQNTFNVTLSSNKTLTTELFFTDENNVKLSDIPNISSLSTTLTINQEAIIGDIVIEEAYSDDLYLSITNSSINQLNDTYSITFDSIWDNIQNNTWTGAMALYAALNNDTYYSCYNTIMFGTNVTASGSLPFSIGYNDVVFFKLFVE